MKKNIIGLAVAATLGLVTLSATAEDMYRGAWYLVPGASYLHADGDLNAKDSGVGAFIRLGKELSESWDIQIGGGYARSTNDIANVGGKYKQTLLGVDALYMFSRDKFRPFLLAGIGAARNNVDYSNYGITDGKKTSFMGNLGAGMQYLFSDNFGVQADLRQVWSTADAKPYFRKDSIHNTYLNLGAIFRFGAPAPVVAAAPEPAPVAAPEPAPMVEEPAPAPMPEPTPACKPTMETVTLSAEQLFGFDKAKITQGGKAALDAAAAKIKANPDVELVMVTGYTDRIGSDAYNQKLSHSRAHAVKDYLVAQGVEANRLEAVGKGEADPVVTCSDKNRSKLIECLAPNRRVVISAQKERETGCK